MKCSIIVKKKKQNQLKLQKKNKVARGLVSYPSLKNMTQVQEYARTSRLVSYPSSKALYMYLLMHQ